MEHSWCVLSCARAVGAGHVRMCRRIYTPGPIVYIITLHPEAPRRRPSIHPAGISTLLLHHPLSLLAVPTGCALRAGRGL